MEKEKKDYESLIRETEFLYVTEYERKEVERKYKTACGKYKKLKRIEQEVKRTLNHPTVERAVINISWSKEGNATAYATIRNKEGEIETTRARANGTGDKRTEVISDLLNASETMIATAEKALEGKTPPEDPLYRPHDKHLLRFRRNTMYRTWEYLDKIMEEIGLQYSKEAEGNCELIQIWTKD